MRCEGAYDCWHATTWREDLRKWLCGFHYRKLNKYTMSDVYRD